MIGDIKFFHEDGCLIWQCANVVIADFFDLLTPEQNADFNKELLYVGGRLITSDKYLVDLAYKRLHEWNNLPISAHILEYLHYMEIV